MTSKHGHCNGLSCGPGLDCDCNCYGCCNDDPDPTFDADRDMRLMHQDD